MSRIGSVEHKNVRGNLKNALLRVFPIAVVDMLLVPWRKLFWWRKNRISMAKNQKTVAKILKRAAPIYLELGSWKRPGMEEWIASDIHGNGDLQLDLRKPIPFPDNSVEKIYSSHLLEHFSYPNPMLDLLWECNRILQPNGIVSLAVPNARIFLDAYYDDRDFDAGKYCAYDVGLTYKNRMNYVNFIAYLGGAHKHLFDGESLTSILQEAGFNDVNLREFDATIDLEERRHGSIYAEGVK